MVSASALSGITSYESPSSAITPQSSIFLESQGSGGVRTNFSSKRKWALGLQSRAHPREIMTEVLKALQELNVYWKKIGHYTMKCRWARNIPGQNETMLI